MVDSDLRLLLLDFEVYRTDDVASPPSPREWFDEFFKPRGSAWVALVPHDERGPMLHFLDHANSAPTGRSH
jgi:hypothetical protein